MLEEKDNILDLRDYCLQRKLKVHLNYNEIKKKLNFPSNKAFEQTETTVKTENKPSDAGKSIFENSGRCDCLSCAQTCDTKIQTDGDEARQSAIDFEDEIQDYVYIIQDPSVAKETSRAKRQIPGSFPEETDMGANKKKEFETESQINSEGEYTYFYKEINDSAQTSFKLGNLKHYTNYAISIRACREKSKGKENQTEPDQCGSDAITSVLTQKREENDLIPVFDAQNINSNGSSLGSIKVTWKAPENPNGLLLSYTIRYKKNDIEHTKWESSCITHKLYLNQSYYILKYLSNGNYSIQIAATSMAGMGNYTAMKYVVINENSGSNLPAIFVTLMIIFLLLVFILAYVCRRYRLTYISNMKLIANVNPDYAGVHYKQDDWEVPRDKIIQLQELGQGSFGMVYEGIIKDLTIKGERIIEKRCAIKTVNENATDKERISFLNEASTMKQFDTAFVVKLLGVVSQTQPTFVVMELMTNGDLKTYLRMHRAEYDNGTDPPPQPPTLRQILQMSAEIADGMSYLAAKKFVHRDLAARNCMVAEDLTVKIGDFGMTRDIYETDYYR